MTDVYVIRNQLGHYWGKSKAWVTGAEPKAVLRVRHEDEALNTLFELSTKDVELRGEIISAPLSERGEPVIEPSEVPLPPDETAAAAAEPEATDTVERTPTDTREAD